MISLRLKTICDLVSSNDLIIDVGTDHAYVPIYLIKNKVITDALGTDISLGAIMNAQKNIQQNKLTKQIKLYQTDGLNNVTENYNTIIISGIGTKNIKEILLNHLDTPKIILQSNNNLEDLRLFMEQNKYNLKQEIVVKENNIYYSIMLYLKGSDHLTKKELLFGRSNNKDYYNYLYHKNKIILKEVPWSLKLKYLQKIYLLKKLI